jgi:hypothetical protein
VAALTHFCDFCRIVNTFRVKSRVLPCFGRDVRDRDSHNLKFPDVPSLLDLSEASPAFEIGSRSRNTYGPHQDRRCDHGGDTIQTNSLTGLERKERLGADEPQQISIGLGCSNPIDAQHIRNGHRHAARRVHMILNPLIESRCCPARAEFSHPCTGVTH